MCIYCTIGVIISASKHYMCLQCMAVAVSSSAASKITWPCQQPTALHVLIFNSHINISFPPLCIFCKNVNHCQCQNRLPTSWIYSQYTRSLCLFSWPHFSQRCPRLCCKFHRGMESTTTNDTTTPAHRDFSTPCRWMDQVLTHCTCRSQPQADTVRDIEPHKFFTTSSCLYSHHSRPCSLSSHFHPTLSPLTFPTGSD